MKDQAISHQEILNSDKEFDLKKWIARIIGSWYWFAGSIFVCLFFSWLYLRYTNPTYQAVASVMIKDEKKSGDISDNAVLKELGIASSKLVENEIEVLRSYDLIQEVVKRQRLYLSFYSEGRIRDVPMFENDLPFIMDVLNADSITAAAKWTMRFKKGRINISTASKNNFSPRYDSIYLVEGIRFRLMPNPGTIWVESNKPQSPEEIYQLTVYPLYVVTEMYSGRLGVDAASKQASVVNLTIKDSHKERGKAILSSLIDIYNSQGLEDKNKVTANTIDFLNERLRSVAEDLKGVEGQVEKFKSSNHVTDISADAEQYMSMARDIDMQKAESQTRLNIVSALERELQLNQDNPGLVPSTLGLDEVSLASLVEKHNSLVLEKERRMKDKEIGPKNPLIIDLQEQVKETRKTLLTNVRNLKEAYQISLNDISRKDEQLRNRIRNVPQLEKKLVEIQRNRNVEEQLYAFLLQKREEAAVTLASNIADSRTIVKSRNAGTVSPKTKMVWLMGGLLGIFIPVIIMLVIDFLNNKVGDETEVVQKNPVPLLGVISHIRKIKSPIVITEQSRSIVAEQFRSLRTSVGFTGRDKNTRSILVTSFQPGDGKSFVSINMASSYALLGKRTVLVELDLRKPHVGKYLGIEAKEGLSSILARKKALKECLIQLTEYNENLYMLPAGYLPPNPSELISSSGMESVMADLAAEFDYIIIDTPPFGLVTDAVLLQKYADITLIVLRQGYTHKDVYAHLNYKVKQNPDYASYVVLNGVGKRKRYERGYRYGKYNYSGYGSDYFDKEK